MTHKLQKTMMRVCPLILIAYLMLCQVSAEEQVKDGAFANGENGTICFDGRNLEGVILSPDYGSSDSTYLTSQLSRIVFCNLPDISWLHLDYVEQTPPSNGCISDIQLPYLIRDTNGNFISTATGSCSWPTYKWNTLLFNSANVTLLLPIAGGGKAKFVIRYRVVSCFIPNVKTTQVGLTTFRVTGCDDGYRLVGGTSEIFTCNTDDGRWESEYAVPKCLEESVTSSSISTSSKSSPATSSSTTSSTSSKTSSKTSSSTSSSTTSISSILSQSSSSSTPPKVSPTSTSKDSAQTTPNSVSNGKVIVLGATVGALSVVLVVTLVVCVLWRTQLNRKESRKNPESQPSMAVDGGTGLPAAGGGYEQLNLHQLREDSTNQYSNINTNAPRNGHDTTQVHGGNDVTAEYVNFSSDYVNKDMTDRKHCQTPQANGEYMNVAAVLSDKPGAGDDSAVYSGLSVPSVTTHLYSSLDLEKSAEKSDADNAYMEIR